MRKFIRILIRILIIDINQNINGICNVQYIIITNLI